MPLCWMKPSRFARGRFRRCHSCSASSPASIFRSVYKDEEVKVVDCRNWTVKASMVCRRFISIDLPARTCRDSSFGFLSDRRARASTYEIPSDGLWKPSRFRGSNGRYSSSPVWVSLESPQLCAVVHTIRCSHRQVGRGNRVGAVERSRAVAHRLRRTQRRGLGIEEGQDEPARRRGMDQEGAGGIEIETWSAGPLSPLCICCWIGLQHRRHCIEENQACKIYTPVHCPCPRCWDSYRSCWRGQQSLGGTER